MPHIHIEKWAARARQDYYMLFIRAWIPFNAWFTREAILSSVVPANDKNCINYICQTTNTFKTKIISLLSSTSIEGIDFRKEIALLHLALESHKIPDAISPISFSNTIIGITSTNIVQKDYRRNHYKVERIPNADRNGFTFDIRVEDKVYHTPKYVKSLNKWKKEDILTDYSYLSLDSVEVKHKIIEYFEEVNPNKPYNVLLTPKRRPDGTYIKLANSFVIDESSKIYFINDTDKIAQVLIHLLYNLRCEIFHGSIDPTEANEEIYKRAYNILYPLVKELI